MPMPEVYKKSEKKEEVKPTEEPKKIVYFSNITLNKISTKSASIQNEHLMHKKT